MEEVTYMQMRSAGWKVAVVLIATLQHCFTMMDEGADCRALLEEQTQWFTMTQSLILF